MELLQNLERDSSPPWQVRKSMTACYVCLCSRPDFVLVTVHCKLKSCLSRELVIFIWVTMDSKLLSCHVLTENESNKEVVSGVF